MPCHPQELQGSGSTPSGPAAGLVRFGQGFGALSVPLLLLISSQRQPAAEEPRLSPAGFPKSSPGSCPTVTAVLGWCLSTPCGHGLPLTDTRGWVLVPLKFKMWRDAGMIKADHQQRSGISHLISDISTGIDPIPGGRKDLVPRQGG